MKFTSYFALLYRSVVRLDDLIYVIALCLLLNRTLAGKSAVFKCVILVNVEGPFFGDYHGAMVEY